MGDVNCVKIRETFQKVLEKLSFSENSGVSEIFNSLFENTEIQDAIKDLRWQKQISLKDKDVAEKRKELGNKKVKANRYAEALREYNLALSTAPSEEKTLKASILANRAMVLNKAKQYDRAIDDCNLCLEMNYPKSTRYKIYQRLATAHESCHNYEDALQALQDLDTSLQDSDVDLTTRKRMKADLESKITQIKKKLKDGVNNGDRKSQELCLQGSNTEYSCLSPKMIVQEMPGKGRGLVATEELNAGEVVAAEQWLASVLHIAQMRSHCWSCHMDCLVWYPCHNCLAIFCSKSCMELGHDKYECALVGLNIFNISDKLERHLASNLHLTFRLITGQKKKFHTEDEELKNRDYKIIDSLISHADDLPLQEKVEHVANALAIFTMLYISNYLDMSDITTFLPLCSRYFGIIQSNSHVIVELSSIEDGYMSKMGMVGLAIYPQTAATFNHSCDPNTFAVNVGKVQYVVTNRSVNPGEEITQVYSGHFGQEDKATRQTALLKRYNFNCDCIACREDYPQSTELALKAKTFQDTPSDGYLKAISEEEKKILDETNEKLGKELETHLIKGNMRHALEVSKQRLNLALTNLKPPHILLSLGMMCINQYTWNLAGNAALMYRSDALRCVY